MPNMDMATALIEEIVRNVEVLRERQRAPAPRVRVLSPASCECQIEISLDLLDEIRQMADRETVLERLARATANVVRSMGTSHCIVSATMLAWHGQQPAVPRFLVAWGADPETGEYLCFGSRVDQNPLRFEPIKPLPLALCGPLGLPFLEQLQSKATIDAHSQALVDKAIDDGALLFVPEELWMTGAGRVLN